MVLLNVFSMLKYGAKIFLAIMGFISFDDINVKPVKNLESSFKTIEKVNFVESLPFNYINSSENTFNADYSYFCDDLENSDKLFSFRNDYAAEIEFKDFEVSSDNSTMVFEKIVFLESENIEDFEVVVLQENYSSEINCRIRLIKDKVETNIFNTVALISLPQSID